MSVGLSQVGFDPKVLEDEEEAAFQQEEQEREAEIRNLIINELDDKLLDDENASFSSHDFRSTTNSRASQQLNDSDIQPKDSEWNSNEYADFPPRRGVFEKPPLLTKKASNFVGTSTDNTGNVNHLQDQNYGYTNYNSNQDDNQGHTPQYNEGEDYDNQSYEFGSFHGNSSDANSNGQTHDAQYDEYNEYTEQDHHGNQYDNGNAYQYGHHGNDHGEFHSNEYEYNNGQGYYDDNEHYDAPVSPADSSQHDEMSPQEDTHAASFPGNYRVQYVPGYRPQPQVPTEYRQDQQYEQHNSLHGSEGLSPRHGHGHGPLAQPSQNTVWRDLRQGADISGSQGRDIPGTNRGGETTTDERNMHGTNLAQLQALYQARGRKIEELNGKLNAREEEMGRQIRVLNHELMMLKDEHKGMTESLAQSQQISQQKQQDIKQTQGKLKAALDEIDAMKIGKLELQEKLNTANSSIDCLNEQLVQMSRADSLTKAREQHESILNAVRKRQEDEILRLKQKLDDTQVSLNWKTEESNRLRDEVMEKANIINRLNRTLDDSQRQCQELLKTGTVTEIANLRTQLQDTISTKTKMDLNCTSMKNEISGLKEELAMYQNALKYGFVDQTPDKHSESFGALGTVRNLNSENWATPKTDGSSTKTTTVDAVSGLRKELEHSLTVVQTKSQQIRDISSELEQARENWKNEKEKVERMEKIMQEQEEKLNKLKEQTQSKSDDQILKVDSGDDLQQKLDDLDNENKELLEKINELQASNQQLTEDNISLKNQMAEMVAEYDEDKRVSLEKCRDACLQLHEDAKEQIRNEMEEEKEKGAKVLRDALEEVNDELVRVKECYLELSEENRIIEKRIRDEVMQEMKQDKTEPEAIEALRNNLEKKYQGDMEKAREKWKQEKDLEVDRIVKEETKKAKEQANKEKAQEIKKAIEEARTLWNQQLSEESLKKRISEARLEWMKEQELTVKKRILDAVNEAKREWEEREKKEMNGKVDEVKKSIAESRDQNLAQALSEARIEWQKEEEETRQGEIEHAVEVAVTNAVAEARQQWEKENNIKNETTYRTLLAKEKHQWREKEREETERAIEAAIAIAEVKWIENEQKKIAHAVDTAVQAVRTTWAHEKDQDIARAVEYAQYQWKTNQEDEMSQALEEASALLVERFEEQKREAVEMALREAKTLWQRNYDHNNNPANIESIRSKLWSEFEETKQEELQRIIEDETNRILDEKEEQRQQELNKAMVYLESKYSKEMEEFKHKELRNALAEARAEWEKEQELEREEFLKKRIATAREEWVKTLDHSSRSEIDRALATAREAWAAEYEDELDDRVNAEVDRARDEIRNEMENEKNREVEEAIAERKKKFEVDERRLKEEISRLKVTGSPQSLHKQHENELSKLREEHQRELDRLREEHEDNTRIARELVEEEFDQKLVAVLHEAKQMWEEEQEEERIQVEDQHQQKLKSVLETAREQFLKDQEKAIAAATEMAEKRQQSIWDVEKKSYQSALEKSKSGLTSLKQEHVTALQKMHKDHVEEIKKIRNGMNERKESGTQTPPNQDSHSPCDSSFGSIDQLTAAKTMNELREHYLETVAKIRDDVLAHVNQTKSNAARKIRSEVLKERHSTAKKLRRYYLQCLKQLLEEDKSCADSKKPPLSVESKMERMAKALEAVSPEPPPTKGDSQSKPNKQQFNRILPVHKVPYRDSPQTTYILLPKNVHCRPGEYGPEGASDSPKPSPSDKPKESQDFLRFNSPVTRDKTKDVMALPERDSVGGNTRISEHAPSNRPPSVQRMFAGSPSMSITSLESEQYSDLPTVIHASPKKGPLSKPVTSSGMTSSKSTLDDVKARALARNSELKPILRGSKPRGPGEETILPNRRVDKSRDPSLKNTPPLPSKPSVNVNRNIPCTGYT